MSKTKSEKQLESVLAALDEAETMADIAAAIADLAPEQRNHKSVAWPVYKATERIVSKTIPPFNLFPVGG